MNLIPRSFFLDDIFDDLFATSNSNNNLKCDIYEKDGEYHIELDVHGFKKEDIKINYEKGYLTVSVCSNVETNDEQKNYIRRERYSKEYKRSFYIGDIDFETVKAKFDDGILKISIPKRDEELSKKIIEIE